ncbi:fluoride efflux transporter FluC [Ekhidna sp.]
MKDILIVGLGGFLGTIARYGVSLATIKFLSDKLYSGTLLVNLTGCLAIGLLSGIFIKQQNQLALFLMVGFCGGFTTFSSFALDGMKLLKAGMHSDFIMYLLASTVGGLALCFLGFFLGNKV